MENKQIIALMILGLILTGYATASVSTVTSNILTMVCNIVKVLAGVAVGLAALVIIVAGIKWIGSSEDAGARAQAKTTIVHALVGLVIIIVAVALVNWTVGALLTNFDCSLI
jgi:hypothetical protein